MQRGMAAWVVAAALVGCTHSGASADRAHAPAVAPAPASQPLAPEAARRVQRALADRGYDLQATGALDAPTRAALAGFQRARGLPESGAVDPATAEALGLAPAELGLHPAAPAPPPTSDGG